MKKLFFFFFGGVFLFNCGTYEPILNHWKVRGDTTKIVSRDTVPAKIAFKVWRGLLSQSGTNPPVVVSYGFNTGTPFENTLGGEIIWSRFAPGQYIGLLPGNCPIEKTWYSYSSMHNVTEHISMRWSYPNSISIVTLDFNGIAADSKLYYTPIEIIVRY